MNVRIIIDLDQDSFCKLKHLMPNVNVLRYDKTRGKHEELLILFSQCFSLLKKMKVINISRGTSRFIWIKGLAKNRVVNVLINHGWGTKRSPGEKEIFKKRGRTYFEILRKYSDYIICYSEFDQTYYLRHKLLEHLPLPKFVPLGHPRNDFLVRNSNNKFLIINEKAKLGIPENSKVILFAPTHRESLVLKNDYDAKLLESYLVELEKLDRQLSDMNVKLLFRPHYYFNKLPEYKFKNICLATSDKFPNPAILMLISDLLVTDYSSIYVDYLLLQKPIAFYQPDLDYYQEVRGLVIDPNNPIHMPGPKISKLSDVLDINEDELKKYDLKASRAFFHKYFDDKATERLAKFLLRIINEEERVNDSV